MANVHVRKVTVVDIIVKEFDQVHDRVVCEPGVALELSDYLRFRPKGFQFTPKFKNRVWDGYIKPYNVLTKKLHCGLRTYVERFATKNNYEVEFEVDNTEVEFSELEAREFVKSLNMPEKYNVLDPNRDYQLHAFVQAIRKKRLPFLIATNGGKTLILYLIARYLNCPTLIVVTSTSLVDQMYSDFVDYGCPESLLKKIYSGKEKVVGNDITISTWQSIFRLDAEWFLPYELFMGDELHHYQAKSLIGIMEKLVNCTNKIGCTGSLTDSKASQVTIEGLFGPIIKIVDNATLIERKISSDIKIKAILLEYSEEKKKFFARLNPATKKLPTYADEIEFITQNKSRNRFITNLTLSLKGNILVLYRFIETHGDILHALISDKAKALGRPVYYINGEVEGADRDKIRAIIEQETDAILLASFGTFSEGINITRINSIIAAHPYLSENKIKQSIGRGIRRDDEKTECTWYDIADDLSWKAHRNHGFNHFIERIKLYAAESFPYKIYKVKLKEQE